jgi:hypothetical protein
MWEAVSDGRLSIPGRRSESASHIHFRIAAHLVSRVRGEEELEVNELIRKWPSGETSYCQLM